MISRTLCNLRVNIDTKNSHSGEECRCCESCAPDNCFTILERGKCFENTSEVLEGLPYLVILCWPHSMELETDRIILRQWQKSDLSVFAQINSSRLAMEHFPNPLTKSASDSLAAKLADEIASCGWGMWAAELKSTGAFIGFVGLSTPLTHFPFFPCVETGWRWHPNFWEAGYATEAGQMILESAFTSIGLNDVIAMTATANTRSETVMKRLGLKNTNNNFFHPNVPANSKVARHLLYRITQTEWENMNGRKVD